MNLVEEKSCYTKTEYYIAVYIQFVLYIVSIVFKTSQVALEAVTFRVSLLSRILQTTEILSLLSESRLI